MSIACENGGIAVTTASLGVSSPFAQVCLCQGDFNGANDLFDNRVILKDGTYYALHCENSIIGGKVVWTLYLLTALIRQAILCFALHEKYKTKGGIAKWSDLYTYMPYRLLSLEVGLVTPGYIVVGFMKSIDTNQVIGSQVAVTILFYFSSFSSIAIYSHFLTDQMKMILTSKGLVLNEVGKRFLSRYAKINAAFSLCYFLVAALPGVLQLAMDKSLGPIDNRQYILLIVRNVGIVLWLLVQLFSVQFIVKETSDLHRALHNVHEHNNENNKESSKQVMEIVGFLRNVQKSVLKTTLVGGVTFIVFTVPFFWMWQQYSTAIVSCMALIMSNIGMIYLQTSRMKGAAKKTNQDSTSSNKELQSPVALTSSSNKKLLPFPQTNHNNGGSMSNLNGSVVVSVVAPSEAGFFEKS